MDLQETLAPFRGHFQNDTSAVPNYVAGAKQTPRISRRLWIYHISAPGFGQQLETSSPSGALAQAIQNMTLCSLPLMCRRPLLSAKPSGSN